MRGEKRPYLSTSFPRLPVSVFSPSPLSLSISEPPFHLFLSLSCPTSLSPPAPLAIQLKDEMRAAGERQQQAIAELQQQHARALQQRTSTARAGDVPSRLSSVPSPAPSDADGGVWQQGRLRREESRCSVKGETESVCVKCSRVIVCQLCRKMELNKGLTLKLAVTRERERRGVHALRE